METSKIDKLFKGKLADHNSAPPPVAWENLESLLDGERKKVAFWYYKVAAAVVLVLISGALVYQFNAGDNNDNNLAQIENVKPPQESNEIVAITPEEPSSSDDIEELLEVNETPKQEQKELTATQVEPAKQEQEEQQYVAVLGSEEEIEQLLSQEGTFVFELEDMNMDGDIKSNEPIAVSTNGDSTVATKMEKKPAVRITYRSSARPVMKRRVVIVAKLDTMKRWRPDLKNILKLPGSLLADVRDAKDYLFNPKEELEDIESSEQ
ncbi:MAG: hypothetical protein JXQ96_08050 [Cyclobacteriaceae bacterium]